METENKGHELDKNPVGPSTSGRKEKAWSDNKYPIVLLQVANDNINKILFPANQSQFLPLVVPELLKFLFL